MTDPTASSPSPPPGATLRRDVRRATDDGYADGLDLDVAVVGAGVSGLYTAFRLLDGDPDVGPGDVAVFEQSDRVGGRLDSVVLPGLDHAGELGGMRYDPDSHRIVDALVEDVFGDRLTATDFPMGDPANHRRYLRGQRFPVSAWTDAQDAGREFETRYFLPDEHAGFSPPQLFRKVIHDVLDADPWFRERYGDRVWQAGEYDYRVDLDRREWNDVKRHLTYEFEGPYEGLPLTEMGLWTVLQDRLGKEGHELLTDAEGYYALTANWNAAQAMADVATDFASPPDFNTVRGGFDLVAYALADAVLADHGATVWTRNALETFRPTPDADRRYALTVANEPGDATWTVHADRVVLAMPRRSLELLDQYNFLFDDRDVERAVDSVFTRPALKLLLAFGEPWWRREFGAEAGASRTDLPIRQCYYFQSNDAPDDDRALFLATYSDERAVSFWSDLADETDPRERRPADGGGDPNETELRVDEAPDRMVDAAMEQVRELHGVDVPDPYAAYYKNWANDPFGGGYNHWKPDVDVRSAMRFMRQPNPDHAVHVVGSAYSGRQGWVEGALCTAEKTLQEHLDAAWPAWLPEEYYLGW
ncbi:MAG: flavin monoamine oxidase family protein [Halobacterium sp.]